MKARVKCSLRGIQLVRLEPPTAVALVDRLSDHPKLGVPRCESSTRTSLILRVDFEKKEMETINTIYWWE